MSTQGLEHERGGEEEERQRREREAALHALAGQSPPTASSAAVPTLASSLPPSPSSTRRSRPLILTAMIVCVLLAGGLGWWRFSQQPHATATGPLILKFPDAHTTCPLDVFWAPDGKLVAVYGNTFCPDEHPNPNTPDIPVIELYDPHSWQEVKTIPLLPLAEPLKSRVVDPTANADQDTLASIAVRASPLQWQPDSQYMLIGISLDTTHAFQQGKSKAPSWDAYLLLDVRTQQASHLTVAPFVPPVASHVPEPLSSYQPQPAYRFDSQTYTAAYIAVPPGLGYRWDASGHLMATEPLPAWNSTPAAPPLGPVGQPLGGASFSIWQQAIVSQATTYAYGCTAPYYPVRIQLSALSPDGRYIVEGLTLNGRFAAPADAIPPPPIDVGTPGPCPPLPTTPSDATSTAPNFVAPLPIRDAGLAAALKVFASEPFTGALNLAWSPDGTRLAVEEAVRPETPAGHLTIYDCASGKALKQYSIDRLDPGFDPVQVTPLRLSWSPDSKQLLVYDYHRLIVLRGATLGG